VAAGSVITKDVPADALAVERSQALVKEGWAARKRAAHAQDKKKEG
jgi:bifunctional UDP-N-acetylglucosamine pyrophosphorylase/glucosamine-1-phosphate N-acetyltransferase